jgi:hypothetical protein
MHERCELTGGIWFVGHTWRCIQSLTRLQISYKNEVQYLCHKETSRVCLNSDSELDFLPSIHGF